MLEKLKLENFDEIYAIMEEAFPPDERRPYAEQKALFSNPAFNVYSLRDNENGEIKVFLTVYEFENFAFIEHFATSAKHRNSGLGRAALCELRDLLNRKICLEAEKPETELSRRRIEFYKRGGFCLNDYEYFQPPISKGKSKVPLKIMTYPNAVSKSEFENIKATLYKNVYGADAK